ncbi:MAG: ATP-dependent endonuclease [Firmicutes bacterium]|nr:ATP-dependent endonuclease [Bacillota bacterium]
MQIKNFRSIEDIDIPIEPLTAFVGPNGAGKTSILRAINIVLGEIWPTIRSFRIPQDFTNFEASRDLEIVVWFEPPYVHVDTLRTEHEIYAIRVSCKPYRRATRKSAVGDLHVETEPLNLKGEVPSVAVTPPQKGVKPQFRPLAVGTELRESARLLFIDHRRSVAQHIPGARGSILGRLLERARKEFSHESEFKDAYVQAMEVLRTDTVKEIEETIATTAKQMLGFLGRDISKSIDIRFGFTDPANPFNSLRLQYEESGLLIPGEELGLGIQSAIVVGIFEAYRQLGGEFGTVVIEEPEMYLHPQAQRYFYRLISEIVDNGQCQVIYSTHSPVFADVNRFECLRLVRKNIGQNTYISFVQKKDYKELEKARSRLKIAGKFDLARNEVLFANHALLVEGHGDKIAALYVAELLGIDVDAEGFSIVDCGGKSGIILVALVCRLLSIPFDVLHDGDIWPIDDATDRKKQEEDNNKEEALNKRIKEVVQDSGQIFVINPTLEEALGIGRNASDKPNKIAERLQNMRLEDLPETLVSAVRALRAEPEERVNIERIDF